MILRVKKTLKLKRSLVLLSLIKVIVIVASLINQCNLGKPWVCLGKKISAVANKVNYPIFLL